MSQPHSHDHPTGPVADASVRLAKESDTPAVGLVQSAVWRDAYADVVPGEVLAAFEPQAFARTWRDSLQAPPHGIYRLLVACAGEQVVGFAAIGPTQDPDAGTATGELLALGVHPQARRSGHGSRLLNAAVDTLRGAGADTMHCWLLGADETTRAFFQASGLGPDGAFRDRVVGPDGTTAREVRMLAVLVHPEVEPETESEPESEPEIESDTEPQAEPRA